jgi:hypothetical protein
LVYEEAKDIYDTRLKDEPSRYLFDSKCTTSLLGSPFMHMFNIFEEIRKQTAIMIDSEGNVHTHEEALRDRLERF